MSDPQPHAVDDQPPSGGLDRVRREQARRDEQAQLRRLEFASALEATTLILLIFVAVPLKHFAGHPVATRIMGPAHGLVFVTFAWLAVQTVAGGGWSRAEAVRLFFGAVIPFGGLVNLPFLSRKAASLR